MSFDKFALNETTPAFFLVVLFGDAFLDLGDFLVHVPGLLSHVFDFIFEARVPLTHLAH